MGFHRQRTMRLWRNPDNVTHRQLLSIDQVWRRSTALTWSRWGCHRLADNIWLLAHVNNNNTKLQLSESYVERWLLMSMYLFQYITMPTWNTETSLLIHRTCEGHRRSSVSVCSFAFTRCCVHSLLPRKFREKVSRICLKQNNYAKLLCMNFDDRYRLLNWYPFWYPFSALMLLVWRQEGHPACRDNPCCSPCNVRKNGSFKIFVVGGYDCLSPF